MKFKVIYKVIYKAVGETDFTRHEKLFASKRGAEKFALTISERVSFFEIEPVFLYTESLSVL